MSKLPKPSKLPKIPQRIAVPLQTISENQINSNSNGASALRRRSKSVTDLRPKIEPPKRNVVEKPTKVFTRQEFKASLVSTVKPRTAVKRVATDKLSEETKPKLQKEDKKGGASKQPEPPKAKVQKKVSPWDYKTRFTNLIEQHNNLKTQFETANTKLSCIPDLEKLAEDKANLQTEYDDLLKSTQELQTKYDLLQKSNNNITKDFHELKENHNNLNANFDALQTEKKNLLQTTEELKAEIDSLQKAKNTLTEELKELKQNFDELTEEHNTLANSHGLLRLESDTMLEENKILRDKLENTTYDLQMLKTAMQHNEAVRRTLHNTVQDLKGSIRVFCRVRPPINKDEMEKMQCCLNFIDDNYLEIRKSRESVSQISGKPTDLKMEFSFDKVFSPTCTQDDVFEELALLVQSALDGYHVCVFAYGQTGSGKTYTMQGENTSSKLGIIPRTVDLIFDTIKKLETYGWKYSVKANFLEIYNENIRDLLDPDSKQSLDIRFNEGKGTTVTNITTQEVKSADQLQKWMLIAQKNRAVAVTDFNEHSSRSHAVTKIELQGTNMESNVIYSGSINLVDLAGSESAKTSSNDRLTETKNINKSLSALGGVMLALYNKDGHVPYRNSKLTYLLQSCLGGNSKTLMFVNIAPFEECYGETINSLRFASKVKEVKTGSKRNKQLVYKQQV